MMVLLPLLGDIMYASKALMEFLPNIHPIAMFIIVFTVVFRAKALIPIYIFVFLTGLFNGFGAWWVGYLYIWAILWAVVMLLPKNMSSKVAVPVYMAVAGLHGLMFGMLFAPSNSLFYGLNFKQTILWIEAGLPYDVIHCIGNILISSLCVPLIKAMNKANSVFIK